ncbi:MAG: bifunctional (p)ppGpp synthetase/guanosine-3',5'-bis(diphosphate) 3'-pyrophosphohydrolase, partial [Woeseiaceae bacterium]|nr:bifunctional (p)ppGpp synthetase/guanosine-3',5'-bis(diphosphate) 3'-pyrophosphohydrolase [Woeseiaceae bacterium]
MSASDAEEQEGRGDSDNIVAKVRVYLATLPKKDGVEDGINEGEQIAAIIAPLGLPPEILAAVYAYPLFREKKLGDKDLQNNDLSSISRFILGLEQLNQFSLPDNWQPGEALAQQQSEALRKMLLAVVSDVRLVLVRLAEQLYRLRAARRAPAALQRSLALETREIYAPLASRLGVWQLKWELEDLAFRYDDADTYLEIAKALNEKRTEREGFIKAVKEQLQEEMQANGINAETSGRPKHIYSIFRKMQRKDRGLESLHDIRAVRILVANINECYAALGIVHSLWSYIPGEFDDYIANPKENDYQSLHTAVIGP